MFACRFETLGKARAVDLTSATIYVVDDDDDLRESLRWLIESFGMQVIAFESAEHFLQMRTDARPACMLVDLRMQGMGGMGLLELLKADRWDLPVIMFTGHGDVATAVRALRAGAFDFIEKPATHQLILDRIHDAVKANQESCAREVKRAAFRTAFAQLTVREREVLDGLLRGDANKAIGKALGISERTVEKHRENVKQKMGTRSLAALIRLVVLYEMMEAENTPST
jgi:FixJ family two-component response regulator